ncbi:MAG TPA: hypothetical protein VHW45_11760 [Candidatus Sulfotelmatobacter sp.]|jgi:hypothetical protein|nr:hypothetical protein [Candidatus Sulfotelmatobacter sp.]
MSRASFRSVSLHKAVLLCLFLVPLAAANDYKYEESHHDTRDFSDGGYLHVRIKVGDLHIKRGDSNKIRLDYRVRSNHENNVKEATVDFDVKGKDATIEFNAHGDNTQFDVELEVPQNTNLDLHGKVGDITVDKIEGDKDLDLGVGDINLAKSSDTYRSVNVSTGIGDVHGADYGEARGWLGKTIKYHGNGKYDLRAHVGVGDIHLDN